MAETNNNNNNNNNKLVAYFSLTLAKRKSKSTQDQKLPESRVRGVQASFQHVAQWLHGVMCVRTFLRSYVRIRS